MITEKEELPKEKERSTGRSCFLYFCRTPLKNDFVKLEILQAQIGAVVDLFVISFTPDKSSYLNPVFPAKLSGIKHYVVDYKDIKNTLQSYTNKVSLSKSWKIIPGNTDTPLIHFFYSHPDYDYYWLMEDDVAFSGDMADLILDFSCSKSDMLATSIRKPPPGWGHTHTLRHPFIEAVNQLIGFFPFFRVSNAFLRAVDRCYTQGWSGHYEIVWPTVALYCNLVIEDIGGDGSYTKEGKINKYYTSNLNNKNLFPGTFCFYPPKLFYAKNVSSLYHPVKPIGGFINSHKAFLKHRATRVFNIAKWYTSRILPK